MCGNRPRLEDQLTSDMELFAELVTTGYGRPCAYQCGLLASPGDTYCRGCREGVERDRPSVWDDERDHIGAGE